MDTAITILNIGSAALIFVTIAASAYASIKVAKRERMVEKQFFDTFCDLKRRAATAEHGHTAEMKGKK